MTIALIPARSGSKRVKDKNIRLLGNKPLLVWSVETALETHLFTDVIVSTDSKQYGQIAQDAGATVIYRDQVSDSQLDIDVVKHALKWLNKPVSIIAYLRPTTPFRDPNDIKQAISIMIEDDEATGLRSVEIMSESAFKCFTLRGQYLDEIAQGQSDLPNQVITSTYRANGYIDIVSKFTYCVLSDAGHDNLDNHIPTPPISEGRLWGRRCVAYITPAQIEIDTEQDFTYAEWWLSNNL